MSRNRLKEYQNYEYKRKLYYTEWQYAEYKDNHLGYAMIMREKYRKLVLGKSRIKISV